VRGGWDYRSILYERYMKTAAMGRRMGMAEQKVKAMHTCQMGCEEAR
jgi:hypothetical protein